MALNKANLELFNRLLEAVERGDVDATETALLDGAPINARSEYGKTPLMFATEYGHSALVTLLRKHGARLDMMDEEGEPALFYALVTTRDPKSSFNIGKSLVLMGASPDCYSELGVPIMHYLASRFSSSELRELVTLGFPLKKTEFGPEKDHGGGDTFLHGLARMKNPDVKDIKALIKAALGYLALFARPGLGGNPSAATVAMVIYRNFDTFPLQAPSLLGL
jgi:ankyrin repeat protein